MGRLAVCTEPLHTLASRFWPSSLGGCFGLGSPWSVAEPRCLLGWLASGPSTPRPGSRAVFTGQMSAFLGCLPGHRHDKAAGLLSHPAQHPLTSSL